MTAKRTEPAANADVRTRDVESVRMRRVATYLVLTLSAAALLHLAGRWGYRLGYYSYVVSDFVTVAALAIICIASAVSLSRISHHYISARLMTVGVLLILSGQMMNAVSRTPIWGGGISPGAGWVSIVKEIFFVVGVVCMLAAFTIAVLDANRMRIDLQRAYGEIEEKVLRRTAQLKDANEQLKREIQERIQTVEEMHRLGTAIEQASEGVAITDAEGAIQYVNPAFHGITGYTLEEVQGNRIHEYSGDAVYEPMVAEMWLTALGGSPWAGRLHSRRKDGEAYQELLSISPVRNQAGDLTNHVVLKRDITREMMLEERLRHSQKMEAVGTLAGGVAHDFRNILLLVLGHCELALSEMPDGEPGKRHIAHIQRAGERGSDLVKQLLTFSRKKETERKPVRLTEHVLEGVNLLRASLPSTIEIHHEFGIERDTVLADPIELHQVVVNLCNNAAQAMPHGGVLDISLRNETVETDRRLEVGVLSAGEWLCLRVQDTGVGMDASLREHIFEPFFTTKPQGEGTGLGLSTVHGIVTGLGGCIGLHSHPGHGAVFEIYLPMLDLLPEKTGMVEMDAPRGSERILFVDDDVDLTDLGAALLQNLGYDVTDFTNSAEALNAVLDAPGSFDVIVTDNVMPKVTGLELARQVRRVAPNLPVILCTGFSDGISPEVMRDTGIAACVVKPFSSTTLGRAIREALAKRPVNEPDPA